MSSGVSAQDPAVVHRSSYQLVRTLLALATIVIVGLTVAVVVLAVNDGADGTVSPAAHANPSAVAASAAADLGAKLDHRGVKPTVPGAAVQPNPQALALAAGGPVVEPNPDQQTAAALVSGPIVEPNPDEQTPAPAAPVTNNRRDYPGHH